MRKPTNILIALIAAVIGGVLLFSPPLRAADPVDLLCPNGQTVQVAGQATPREALLLFLRGRPVGGGLSGADGRFSIPLRAQERPGIYPVEVRLRASRTLVASYTCYVDVPLGEAPTPTTADNAPVPTATVSQAVPTLTPTTATTARPTAAGAATSQTTGVAGTATTQPTAGTATTPNATTTTTTTTTITTTATVTTTTTTSTDTGVEINDIVLRDPAFPDVSEEYVQIRNAGDNPVNLAGWTLRNATRGNEIPPYTFPSFRLGVDVTIAVFSAIGDDDVSVGDFYWDRPADVWRVGDRAELRDAQGRLVNTLIVPQQ